MVNRAEFIVDEIRLDVDNKGKNKTITFFIVEFFIKLHMNFNELECWPMNVNGHLGKWIMI